MTLLVAHLAAAQQLFEYTENDFSGNTIPLGYPVPIPVESTLPFDGFRSYASLHARHQDLSLQHDFIQATIVGQTLAGRDIWAYQLSDPDQSTRFSGPESSALVIGGVHAREWASPELTTGLIEAYATNAGDQHLYDYLIDNVTFTVLPVTNIDGFLQTQRYPTEVFIGQDPREPSWPRDGRMRRKNMNNVDEFLLTNNDHLFGVDINRNNTPFWASSSASSFDPTELVYHGTSSFSEPENVAILAAAALAGTDRLRWYQDSHSFSQVFFSKYTFNQRRNRIQDRLLTTYSQFHDGLSLQRNGERRVYRDVPDPAGVGIGTTAGYFAYTHQIPSWTLEIEPQNGGEDYGGFGANHDGFVLPESEVTRMRTDMAITHAVVTYKQAGPPTVREVQILDDRGRQVYFAQWTVIGNGQRQLQTEMIQALLPGFDYQLRVSFDKPMRWEDQGPALAPGLDAIALTPNIRILEGNSALIIPNREEGQWLGRPGSDEAFLNYRYDTFTVDFSVPAELDLDDSGPYTLSINVKDFTGQSLDANPATITDWSGGRWVGYESTNGSDQDRGGSDRTLAVPISPQWMIRPWLLRGR